MPFLVKVTTADVIHSFWVPQLHGKIDLIPGQTNTIWLEASEPGVYRGECAEYCGLQHTNMDFVVVAEGAGEFQAWLINQAKPVPVPSDPLVQAGPASVPRLVVRVLPYHRRDQCVWHAWPGPDPPGQPQHAWRGRTAQYSG